MSFFPKQPSSRAGATQTIAFDANAAIADAFGPEAYQLRLVANAACCYRIGDGPQTATAADPFLPANTVEHVIVSPGQRLSVIKAPGNGLVADGAGTLWITEMS
jgi:hypothetical protein